MGDLGLVSLRSGLTVDRAQRQRVALGTDVNVISSVVIESELLPKVWTVFVVI